MKVDVKKSYCQRELLLFRATIRRKPWAVSILIKDRIL